MLHVNIEHNPDSTIKVVSIVDVAKHEDSETLDELVLAEFNEEQSKIDFSVANPYKNQQIIVNHTFLDGSEENYSMLSMLKDITFDKDTMVSSLVVDPIMKIEE